jgi:hypothetical protein
MTKTLRRALLVACVVAVSAASLPAFAYCLTGVRWPSDADVYYNPSGKVTGSQQCISASAMDSAVTGGITPWGAISYAGTTGAKANSRDGQNTVGWAKLGGGTLGITNYLSSSRFYNWQCGSNRFADLFEADVRHSTSYRWFAGGSCPCAAGSAFNLNSVSTHEFGHVIGLCHTNQPSSLMYPSFDVCQTKNKGSDENSGEGAIYGGQCSPL